MFCEQVLVLERMGPLVAGEPGEDVRGLRERLGFSRRTSRQKRRTVSRDTGSSCWGCPSGGNWPLTAVPCRAVDSSTSNRNSLFTPWPLREVGILARRDA